MNIDLTQYGWDNFFEHSKKSSENKTLEHGRVISVHKSRYEIVCHSGVFSSEILGKLQFKKDPMDIPSVGDWVLFAWEGDMPVIHELLARKTIIKRQKKHDHFPKPIAANVDKAIIMQAVGEDFSIKRIERILVHLREARVEPIIVINKIDLLEGGLEGMRRDLASLDTTIPVVLSSYKTGEGIDRLESLCNPGETIMFIGSSGVGKSSIINTILKAEKQETQEITLRTGKGKHTTTARRLFITDTGVLVVDTPGTREFGMHGENDKALNESFADIESLLQGCQFSNCRHGNEPGCHVQNALRTGEVDTETYNRYLVLQNELAQSAKQMRQSEKQSTRPPQELPARSVRKGKKS